jgi:transposase-like protein
MSKYQKIMRKLISHPGSGIEMLRMLTARHRKCCVKCGVVGHLQIHHTDQRKIRTYQCQACKKTFTETYGTIFYKSKIPISNWLLAIIFWISATGSISAADLSRKLGVSHPTAWKILIKIRKQLSKGLGQEMLEGLVEADEAWFGKKENQEIVMGIVERGKNKIRLIVIPNLKEKTLYPHIQTYVKKGSRLFTDSRVSYAATNVHYWHQTTNHSKGEFAINRVIHSNTIEQIWGDIKGIIRTIHHGVSKKYRKLYLAQYAFSYQFKHSSNLFFKTLCQLFSPTYCLI